MDNHQQDSGRALEDLMRYDWAEWQGWDEEEGEYEPEGEYEEAEETKESQDVTSEDSVADFGVENVERRRRSILRRKTAREFDALRILLALGSRRNEDLASIETEITLEGEEVRAVASVTSDSSSKIHPCLRTIDASDSQLELLKLFNIYPVPDDPGNVRAFWVLYDPVPVYPSDGITRFSDTMKTLNLKPIACVSNLLRSDVMNLRYYGLDPRAVEAVSESVYDNTVVQSLDLKDNWLTPEACIHLNHLLLESEILGSMNLSGCKIGYEGVKNMLSGITVSWSLVELDLSHCRLGNEGFNLLAPIVENVQQLQTLNLSDNQLGTECAEALNGMLAHNTHLLKLNLSWNGLFTKEVSNGLFKGLLENKTLVSVNLSWNAFAKETLGPLNAFLQQNETLVTLNLSGNRFDEQAGRTIAKSLAKNVGLQELYLGDNPLKPAGGFAIVHALIPEQSPNTSLNYVDLENVWVNKDVLPDLEKIETGRPSLRVKLGGIFSNYKLVGPDEQRIFFKRANFEGMKPKKKKQRRDFGHFILSLEDKMNTRENFKQLVKAFKIKLSESLVNTLMTAFPGPNKKVDQTKMKALYLEQYPDTTAPPIPTPKKKKGKKIELAGGKKKERVDDNSGDKSKKREGKSPKVARSVVFGSGTEGESDAFEGEEKKV